MYGEPITHVSESKFLGITFDSKLNFKSHFKNIKESLEERLKVIKVLSSSYWSLNKSILLSIYKLLMRSLIEYSASIYTITNPQVTKSLQILQNEALRTIMKMKREEGNAKLHKTSGMPEIDNRLTILTQRYLERAIINNNPLITQLINEWSDPLNSSKPTIICKASRTIVLDEVTIRK